MIAAVVAVAGIAVQAAVWRSIARGRLPFWPATVGTFAALGLAALVVGSPRCCATVSNGIAIGLASGLVLYIGARLAVGLFEHDPRIAAAVSDVYAWSQAIPRAGVWVLTLAIAVPGEELFWRGLVLTQLRSRSSLVIAMMMAWFAYVLVNLLSGKLPLVAAAVVCGQVWTVLGSNGDVGPPLASHLVWTGLMLLWPPRAARGNVPS
jgi:uncharacterized protein